ncbi:MAG: YwiC-like family protein [Gemmatimonadota bacterium]|jgi:hypothetical protein
MPKEHGAYAQLAFPLLSGLLLGGGGVAGVLYVVAAVSVFLAHEPVAVLVGVRGRRLQERLAASARRRAVGLLALAASAGLAALALAPPRARPFFLVPAGLAALLLPLVPARKVKTLAGEILVAAAMAANHLPLAAGSLTDLLLWAPATVWFTGFALAGLTVHGIKVRFKGRRRGRWTVFAAPGLALVTVAVALTFAALSTGPRRWMALALVPVSAVVLVLGVRSVHPRHLRRVGWTLVAAETVTLALVLLARLAP